MARLFTTGMEGRIAPTTTATSVDGFFTAGPPAIETTIVRGLSTASSKHTAATTYWNTTALTTTNGRAYYCRGYFYLTANPGAAQDIIRWNTGAGVALRAVVQTDGTIQLQTSGGAQIGTASAAIPLNTWFRLEVKGQLAASPTTSNGTTEAKIDGGTSFGVATNANLGTTAPTQWRIGLVNGVVAGYTLYLDDVAINDDQGANENTWPGEGNVVLLKAASDASRGNWTGGAGGTTSLFDAINNTPPIGSATATNANQIRNTTSGLNQFGTFNCETYTSAGIDGTYTIKLAAAVGRYGAAATGTLPGGISVTSNPADSGDATFAFRDAGANAGTEPAGWKSVVGNLVYAPTVTLGTAPIVRVNKNVALTTACYFDQVGLMVEVAAAGAALFTQTVTATSTGAATAIRQARVTIQRTATGTSSILKASRKQVAAVSSGLASTTKRAGHTVSASASGLASLSASRIVLILVTATSTSVAVVRRGVAKLTQATGTGAAQVTKRTSKSTPATASGTPVVNRTASFVRTLIAQATGTTTLSRSVRTRFDAFATGSASAIKAATTRVTATASGTANVAKTLVSQLLITATATGTAAARRTTAKLTSATASGAALTRSSVQKSITAVAAGAAASTRVVRTMLSATATGTATATRSVQSFITITASAVADASLFKDISRVVTVSAVGSATAAKNVATTVVATALGVPLLVRSLGERVLSWSGRFGRASSGSLRRIEDSGSTGRTPRGRTGRPSYGQPPEG